MSAVPRTKLSLSGSLMAGVALGAVRAVLLEATAFVARLADVFGFGPFFDAAFAAAPFVTADFRAERSDMAASALPNAFLAASAAFRALRAALLAFLDSFFACFSACFACCARSFASAAARSVNFRSRLDASARARALCNIDGPSFIARPRLLQLEKG
jgi:hypothetical protein